eukprot:6212865-Pleurochrysis_carterae.AAC.2
MADYDLAVTPYIYMRYRPVASVPPRPATRHRVLKRARRLLQYCAAQCYSIGIPFLASTWARLLSL